jgi:hypothetical protein
MAKRGRIEWRTLAKRGRTDKKWGQARNGREVVEPEIRLEINAVAKIGKNRRQV